MIFDNFLYSRNTLLATFRSILIFSIALSVGSLAVCAEFIGQGAGGLKEGGVISGGWVISDKLFSKPVGAKEVLLQKDVNGRWAIKSEASEKKEGVESFLVDFYNKVIYLNVGPSTTTLGPEKGGQSDQCSFGLAGFAKDERTGKYRSNDRDRVGITVCNSEFTLSSKKGVVDGLIGIVSLAYASHVTPMAVNVDAIGVAVEDSGLISAVEADFLEAYRKEFSNSKNSRDWGKFIQKYKGYDPDQLLIIAENNRDKAIREEGALQEERRQRLLIEEANRKEAQAKAYAIQRQQEEQQRLLRVAQVEAFRKTIKIETQTNCGPVLEIKGGLVKIYFPIANYGSEHWIRKELLFPASFGCEFHNGNYRPPLI